MKLNVNVQAQGVTLGIWGDTRFLVSADDFSIVEFRLDKTQWNPFEGFMPLVVTYEDVLGHKYRYTCKLRYAGDQAAPAEETDDPL